MHRQREIELRLAQADLRDSNALLLEAERWAARRAFGSKGKAGGFLDAKDSVEKAEARFKEFGELANSERIVAALLRQKAADAES